MAEIRCSTCGEMDADKIFLHENGWDHWYCSYWTRPDTVSDPTRQDYTNYQLTTEQAMEFTRNPKPAPYVGDLGAALKYIVENERKLEG